MKLDGYYAQLFEEPAGAGGVFEQRGGDWMRGVIREI